MKKGIAMIIPLIIVLGLLLLGEFFVVGVYARKEYTVSRFFSEVKYISESDKIETYVRSFQDAIALSLIQSCYDSSFRTNKWQVYVAPSSYQNTIESEINIRNSIGNDAINNVKNYLNEYINFIQFPDNGAEELVLSDTANIKNPAMSWDDTTATIKFDRITFRTNDNSYKREFSPMASINTKMSKIQNTYASNFINNYVNTAISSISPAESNCNINGINSAVDGQLNTIKNQFNNDNKDNGIEVSGFKRSSTITVKKILESDGTFTCCRFNVELAINITDVRDTVPIKYVVYNGVGVSEESLGFRFFIETGNANICVGCAHPPCPL
jgi:hypothetical protein